MAADTVQEIAKMLVKHLDEILYYCHTKVRFGVVEAVNGNVCMQNSGRSRSAG